MTQKTRPDCIAHWTEIEEPDDATYTGDNELLSVRAPFARHFALSRLGINHERLAPGRRTSYPHAESSEDEFVYVIDGTPDVWLDGNLYRLQPGDAVGFPAATGLCHTFINNTPTDVRLLVVGEPSKPENRVFYPRNPEQRPIRSDWWDDAPARERGGHDGLSDQVRDWRAGRRPTQD